MRPFQRRKPRDPSKPRPPKKPRATSIIEPKPATLARYGVDLAWWRETLAAQGGVCALTGKLPYGGRLVVDHEHVDGWKRMRPWERRRYVRGLIGPVENGVLVSYKMTFDKAQRIFRYLEAYETRRPTQTVKPGKRAHRATCIKCGQPFEAPKGAGDQQLEWEHGKWVHGRCIGQVAFIEDCGGK